MWDYKTIAVPQKTHPPGKPSRPSKRICICGMWQRLLCTHTLMNPNTETHTYVHKAQAGRKRCLHLLGVQGLTCMHAHTHGSAPPHQYDMSNGNFPKQLSFCVTVEHHMTCMPAAWARQRLRPRQLSTCHLQEYTQTQSELLSDRSELITDHTAWPPP